MYIIGAGGHGKVIAEIVEENSLEITAFVDYDPNKSSFMGYRVVQDNPPDFAEVVLAIGSNSTRKRIALSNEHFLYPVLIHPRANLSRRVKIGKGTVVMAGATINADAVVGAHCIINTNASVDHECKIGNFVHLSPNVALAGNVTVGEGTHVGIGACVIQGITIGSNCIIGASAVIIRDVPDGMTVVGNPGKIIKHNG